MNLRDRLARLESAVVGDYELIDARLLPANEVDRAIKRSRGQLTVIWDADARPLPSRVIPIIRLMAADLDALKPDNLR